MRKRTSNKGGKFVRWNGSSRLSSVRRTNSVDATVSSPPTKLSSSSTAPEGSFTGRILPRLETDLHLPSTDSIDNLGNDDLESGKEAFEVDNHLKILNNNNKNLMKTFEDYATVNEEDQPLEVEERIKKTISSDTTISGLKYLIPSSLSLFPSSFSSSSASTKIPFRNRVFVSYDEGDYVSERTQHSQSTNTSTQQHHHPHKQHPHSSLLPPLRPSILRPFSMDEMDNYKKKKSGNQPVGSPSFYPLKGSKVMDSSPISEKGFSNDNCNNDNEIENNGLFAGLKAKSVDFFTLRSDRSNKEGGLGNTSSTSSSCRTVIDSFTQHFLETALQNPSVLSAVSSDNINVNSSLPPLPSKIKERSDVLDFHGISSKSKGHCRSLSFDLFPQQDVEERCIRVPSNDNTIFDSPTQNENSFSLRLINDNDSPVLSGRDDKENENEEEKEDLFNFLQEGSPIRSAFISSFQDYDLNKVDSGENQNSISKSDSSSDNNV
jgi:hypothetical protein